MDLWGIIIVSMVAITILVVFIFQFISDKKSKMSDEMILLVANSLKMPNSSRDLETVIKNVKDEVNLKVSY